MICYKVTFISFVIRHLMFSCKYSYCKIPCESPGLIIKSYGFGVSFNNGGEGGAISRIIKKKETF